MFSRTPFLSYLISSSFLLLFFYSLHLKSSLLFLLIVLFSVIFSLSYLSYLSPLSHIYLYLYLPLISSYLISVSYYTLPYLLIRLSPLMLTMKCSLLFLFTLPHRRPYLLLLVPCYHHQKGRHLLGVCRCICVGVYVCLCLSACV